MASTYRGVRYSVELLADEIALEVELPDGTSAGCAFLDFTGPAEARRAELDQWARQVIDCRLGPPRRAP